MHNPDAALDFARDMQQRMESVTRDYPLPKGVHPGFWQMMQVMASQPVHSLANTCLELGKVWGQQDLAPASYRGEQRQCFMNAGQLAIDDSSLTYVEGMACTDTLGFAVHHAWLVDRQGRVVEPTWPNGHSYCGLPIKQDVLARVVLQTQVWGLFGSLKLPRWVTDDIAACIAEVPGRSARQPEKATPA